MSVFTQGKIFFTDFAVWTEKECFFKKNDGQDHQDEFINKLFQIEGISSICFFRNGLEVLDFKEGNWQQAEESIKEILVGRKAKKIF